MKFGIYYAYWATEWGGEFIPYVEKVKGLGFDILEVACGNFDQNDLSQCRELRRAAEDNGILLTGGYGPRPEHNLASTDEAAVEKAFGFYGDVFRKMEAAGIQSLCGALYSYWPVDTSGDLDKPGDLVRSARRMQRLANMAADYGITLHMEALNRFEGYLINDCQEAVAYVRAVDRPNVKVMLDTFHMNIEEDSLVEAIALAGPLLGHFHVGEANRRPPRPQGRIPWKDLAEALRKIGYQGHIVMEPFVRMGGQVGKDISIWRDLSHGATDAQLDQDAAASVAYLRSLFA